MTLKEFLSHYDVDKDAVAQIGRRLFVVGRFNQANRRKDPEIFLFTNRPAKDLPSTYKNRSFITNFTQLRYEKFVELLRPALAETVTYIDGIPKDAQIPKVKQLVPRNHLDALEGTAIVDTFHYLFLRAISTTEQGPLLGMKPTLPLALAAVGSEHAGEGIFRLIRQCLNTFAKFQPRTHEIVDTMAKLMETCGKQGVMPEYAHGGALPGGFPEKLIDFVYAEDTPPRFSTEGLDFSRHPWNILAKNPATEQMFVNVVVAFRNALLMTGREEFGTITFDNKTLDEQAEHLFLPRDGENKAGESLRAEFNQARESFNTLRQLLRSKAMISIVLEWVLSAYYDLDEVPRDRTSAERDARVGELIVKGKAGVVAEPVLRPNPDERERVAALLAANLEQLVLLLSESEEVFESKVAEVFPKTTVPKLHDLARRLRKNPAVTEGLARFKAPIAGADPRHAFVEAQKVLLLDVLCPVLFDQPIVTAIDLRYFFRQATLDTYMMALALDQANQDAVALIGRKNIKFFKDHIDKDSQTVSDEDEISALFLGELLRLATTSEAHARMVYGLRVLKEAETILENVELGGPSAISAVRPEPKLKPNKTLEMTGLKPNEIERSLHRLVEKMVRYDPKVVAVQAEVKRQEAARSQNSADGLGDGQAEAQASTDSAAGADSAQNESPQNGKEQETKERESETSASARKAVSGVLSKFFKGRDSSLDVLPSDIDGLVGEARGTLEKDAKFMDKTRAYVRAFEQILFTIYQRYVENQDPTKADFTNKVDRFTLINMMLLGQKELGLGTVSSNLYALLIDLVDHLDREHPVLKDFIKKVSLTRYFDDAKLRMTGDVSGITTLRETLHAQAVENLRETKDFVSELWGIRYLMKCLENDDMAEIFVVNADAGEFLEWVKRDNLTSSGAGRFRSEYLVTRPGHLGRCVLPGLIYFTDSAFPPVSGDNMDPKSNFLAAVAAMQLKQDDPSRTLRYLLPPICLSTRAFDDRGQWYAEGTRWAEIAADAPAPVVVVGPSALLNKKDDYFKTYLPAGYMFAAHFLRCPMQEIRIDSVDRTSKRRFRVIGRGTDLMSETLQEVLWAQSYEQHDRYSFATDYYLYTILTLLLISKGASPPSDENDAEGYYENFFRFPGNPLQWREGIDMNPFLIAGKSGNFSVSPKLMSRYNAASAAQAGAGSASSSQNNEGSMTLRHVDVDQKGIIDTRRPLEIRDVGWFNLARERAGLD